jgi:CubicO group peptidase (beta-lactamase class C family)
MISLGRVIETIVRMPLSEFCRKRIFDPLGMKDTGYDPVPARCAPATPDLLGVVHDPLARAYRSKGSHDPGNAGLFSTADDLGIFCRALLQGRLLRPETVRRMFQPDSDTRGLGWDVFDDAPYRPGVGHTGFTGTLVWMNPDRGRYAIVLSNRVYHDEKVDVRRLRKEVLAAVNAD